MRVTSDGARPWRSINVATTFGASPMPNETKSCMPCSVMWIYGADHAPPTASAAMNIAP